MVEITMQEAQTQMWVNGPTRLNYIAVEMIMQNNYTPRKHDI
jgi:hypothetical protein